MMNDDDWWWRWGCIKNPRPLLYTNSIGIIIIKWSWIFVSTTASHIWKIFWKIWKMIQIFQNIFQIFQNIFPNFSSLAFHILKIFENMRSGGRNKNLRPLYYTNTHTISIIKWSRILVSITLNDDDNSKWWWMMMIDDQGVVKTKNPRHFIILKL